MFQNGGFANTLTTNGLSYDDFRSGYYFVVNDLSTSGKCGISNLIPAIRVGHLRLKVLFSQALPLDINALLLCEYPATVYLNKQGRVTGSFI